MAAGDIALKPGRTGSFEITRDGKTVFSKLDSVRFPEAAELDRLV